MLSQSGLAKALRCSKRTVAYHESGEFEPGPDIRRKFHELKKKYAKKEAKENANGNANDESAAHV